MADRILTCAAAEECAGLHTDGLRNFFDGWVCCQTAEKPDSHK